MTGAPQDEHELTAALAPESPILFHRARRLLADWTRDAAARFRVGRLEAGCWSVLRAGDGWRSVRTDGDDRSAIGEDHETARAAVAHAVGGLLTEAGTGLNPKVFQMAGIIRPAPDDLTDRGPWYFTEAGERLRDASEDAPRPGPEVPCVPLERLIGREPGYFALRREPAPERGGFVTVHRVFELAVRDQLPDGPGDPAETLAEGTVLDGYGGTDQVFLYEPGTPFHKRGLQGMPEMYEHRFYEVRRPLRVHPAFPLEYTIVPRGRSTGAGRGFYLVDSIADLLRDGRLAETTGPRGEAAR
ncbi:glycohydrolase toxin TNT-related protein [Actinomadura sp. LD22]|uniref:Glycohydrolase toxin TNT-related protein n=1 Tax=Actinomadura physcomitrii TaxID=2650748 RepID=A0A6I4MQ71_9ACTN|nr:glycohydrolase toxin TNT-related protein [Actinomadura physcomitrii]MWA06017.1 glycohydrolase toxin TNT-related protein [Actinomadura physcomitrii]